MTQLSKFKYDVIGLCETRAKLESRTKWLQTGDEIIIGEGSGQQRVGGVGFIINSRIVDRVIEAKIHSHRIATLKLDIGRKTSLLIIQIYAPHKDYGIDELEKFYAEVETHLDQPAYQKIVIGDFNAQLGPKTENQRYLGKFTSGTWDTNESGELLTNFADANKLFIINTLFQKPPNKRWTFESTNANKSRHEIDFGLCTDRLMVTNIEFLSRLDIGSDHRAVRFTLNTMIKKQRPQIKNSGRLLNEGLLQRLIAEKDWTIDGSLSTKFDKIQRQLNMCIDAASTKKSQPSRFTDETNRLLLKRKCMNRQANPIEFAELSKLIRRKIHEDHEKFRTERLLKTIKERRSLKRCQRDLRQQTTMMSALKADDGTRLTKHVEMERRVQEYYTSLFASKSVVPLIEDNREDEETPPIIVSEVQIAVQSTKTDKAPGPDGIANEALKAGGYELWKILANLFNECLEIKDIPTQWKTSSTIIIPKKGDREDLKNYRPIALLPTIYKIFTKVLVNRMTRHLDEQQPREQAGFRSGFSTTDHLQAVNQILERTRECKIPLCMIFVDYEKAFDSIEINAIINALVRQNVPKKYIQTILNINTNCSTSIRLFHNDIKIPINRGVRQGDTISPKLFTAALEEVFRTLKWENRGIMVDGEPLTHLRFADDIVLFAYDVKTVAKMLKELNLASARVGLRINRAKTQAMKNDQCATGTIKLDDDTIQFVNKYTYLGQTITYNHNIDDEIRRRRSAAWLSFKNIEETLKKTKNTFLRAHLFNSTILPVLNYGSEVWTMRESDKQKLQKTQRAMERRVLGIRLAQKIPSRTIRQRTNFKDVYMDAVERKFRWAGHVARREDNRWTHRTTFWWPYNFRRPRGRPADRWRKLMQDNLGKNWHQLARSRMAYKHKMTEVLSSMLLSSSLI